MRIGEDKAVALILSLFILLFMSLLVVAFLDFITIEQQIITNNLRSKQATFIAEAGVEAKISQIRYNWNNQDVWDDPIELDLGQTGSCSVSAEVSNPGGSNPIKTVTIDSIGRVMGFQRRIQTRVLVYPKVNTNKIIVDYWKDLGV